MSSPRSSPSPDVHLRAPIPVGGERILTAEALGFVAELTRTFRPRVEALLERRREVQARRDAGEMPAFLEETREIRESEWTVAPIPKGLEDRRVEITGPVDRKMVINALNSGASVFMADFEDANSPTWENVVLGQGNLFDAVRGTITYDDPDTGKSYRLASRTAVLLARPRGWHLLEKHAEVDGRPIPASLFDFGLYFFHNAKALLEKGSGPFFYLPKMQSHLEARLWNDVFVHAQRALGIPNGTIRGTVLIETLPAAFEMDEILWELRDHSGGLNCGRWDYIFSFIKTLLAHPWAVLPDRAQVTMEQPFLRAYTQLLVKTCHRRGIHAMGGMAAQIPIKRDAEANRVALEKVRHDKQREVRDGHDGTWVAHPGLVPVAKEIFDEHMPTPNQLHKRREDVHVGASDLLAVPQGTRTEKGLRWNVRVGVQYLEAWLRGSGCVPLYDLMEDAATAEISRTQIAQWIRHAALLEDGRPVTRELLATIVAEEITAVKREAGDLAGRRFDDAAALFEQVAAADPFVPFLTLPAYDVLTREA
ncbi:MAG TPA: malate synthase A [Candidatus Polarisedimenticolaceae bacterium]